MDDLQFDALVEQFQSQVSKDEYDKFRDSLHEVKGKVKHPFIMGSLDKLKIEEPDNIIKFLKTIKGPLNISAKVDGISCRLQYNKGVLVSASTRGDGSFGEDITDKIKFVKNVPQKLIWQLQDRDEVNVRGELVILKDDFASMNGFANPRNACAGIMNRKDWSKEDVANVSFIAYTILGDEFMKQDQFSQLLKNGFKTAWFEDILDGIDYSTIVNDLKTKAEQDFDYETDGLVICSGWYKNETKYRPDECKAVKINQLIATTKLIDIEWEGPTKDGRFVPIFILEPVTLGGSVISRCTGNNIDYLNSLNVDYGDTVKILKSGDIIPRVLEVVSKL